MSDKEGDNKAAPEKKKTLTLRGGGISQGTVRQNFSHGRSKSVVVETRKRRISKPGETAFAPKPAAPAPAEPPQAPVRKPKPKAVTPPPSNLSKSEMEARQKALEIAKSREAEDLAKAEAEKARIEKEDREREERIAREAEAKAAEEARLAAERAEAERQAAADASAAAAKAEEAKTGTRPPARNTEEPKPKELKTI